MPMDDKRMVSFRATCMNLRTIDLSTIEKIDQTVHAVFYGNAENYISKKELYMSLLSKAESDRMEKFIYTDDRLTYCISHGLLRISLAEKYKLSNEELELEFFSNGKPHLKNLNADFNLSHSKKYFAYSIADNDDGTVGVDIEKIESFRNINSIVKEQMHLDEQAYVLDSSLSPDKQLEKFYEIWTRKEAFLKMLGVGIVIKLSEVNMVTGDNAICVDIPQNLYVKHDTVYLYTLTTNDFVLSVSSNLPKVPSFIEVKPL